MQSLSNYTGPRSAVGNVSGYRCVSDCRSRDREFDSGPVPYFRGDWSWNNFYGHSSPFRWFIQEGLLSVTSESMCTNYWLTACSSLPRKKCGKLNWPSRNDHSCWLGTLSNKTNKQKLSNYLIWALPETISVEYSHKVHSSKGFLWEISAILRSCIMERNQSGSNV